MKIDTLKGPQGLAVQGSAKNENAASGFSQMLEDFIGEVNNDLGSAKVAQEKLVAGDVKNLEEMMYQIEKADISLRLITEIRNKALESYQEIMRMQV